MRNPRALSFDRTADLLVLALSLAAVVVVSSRIFGKSDQAKKLNELVPFSDSGGASPSRVVIFSDYKCPWCAKLDSAILDPSNRDILQVTSYRHLVSPTQQEAHFAAEISACAARTEGWQEVHRLLFSNRAKLLTPFLEQLRDSLSRDSKVFANCISTGEGRAEVDRDFRVARINDMVGTPTVIVDGLFDPNSVPTIEQIRRRLDR